MPTARAAIEQAGCRLVFLPIYSPDFNPSELAFAKCKQRFRRLQARSLDAVGQALAEVTVADARAFFREADYPT